jgi:hypothetical protein
MGPGTSLVSRVVVQWHETSMIKTFLSLQLVRQILGALGGALVGLALFHSYRTAAPMVRAVLLPETPRIIAVEEEELIEEVAAQAGGEEEASVVVLQEEEAYIPSMEQYDAPVFPDETPISLVTATPVQMTEEDRVPLHAGAPALPASGLGWSALAAVALGASLALRRKRSHID